jgi:hypothetical protein
MDHSDGTVAELMVLGLISDGHPLGAEGDSVSLAMSPVALVLAPVACARRFRDGPTGW